MKVKELKQIVNVYKALSQLYIIKRDKPAYKTGNLYDRVGLYNTYEKMVTIRPSKSTTNGFILILFWWANHPPFYYL